jgi:kelch-like protein 2/3
MSISRYELGVGILDGVLYAVGGTNGSVVHKSVEAYRPSTGIWSFIADMHCCRTNPGNLNNYLF